MNTYRFKKTDGFTLVETLFSLVVFSLAIVFVYSTFVVNTRMYNVENDVLELQQMTRTAMDEISRMLLMTGANVPQGAIQSDMGFLYAITPGYGGPNSPDTLIFMRGIDEAQAALNNSMPSPSAELKVDEGSPFESGQLVIIQGNTLECGETREMFVITHVQTDEGQGQDLLQHRYFPPWNMDQSMNCSYLAPSTITRVDFMKYYIDESDRLHPCLIRSVNETTQEILATDIENFKITYDLLTGERGLVDPLDPDLIRQINVLIVGRTPEEDSRWQEGVHSLTGESDGYRRYRLQTDVFLRNMGM